MSARHDAGAREGSRRELEARFFAVGVDPYCVWDWGLAERNVEYLEDFDPDYFDYVGRANLPHLKSDDPDERRRAATAIRTAYHHGLESFFALLFATLQAPWCVPGWMQVYQPKDLRDMARAVDPAFWGTGERRKQTLAFRKKLLPHVWPRPRTFSSWRRISRAVHRLDAGEEQAAKAHELFGRLWHGFAKDLTKDSFVSEYNSIKHGLRAKSGGFYMRMGAEPSPGEKPPPGAMRSVASSEHGSSFFAPRMFVGHPTEKDRKARPGHGRGRTSHFRIRRQALNWDPEGLCDALALISVSVHNVRSLALWLNGADPSSVRFTVPEEGSFRASLGRPQGFGFTDMDSAVLEGDVRLFERARLEEEIREGIADFRERLDPAPVEGREGGR